MHDMGTVIRTICKPFIILRDVLLILAKDSHIGKKNRLFVVQHDVSLSSEVSSFLSNDLHEFIK